VSDTEHDPSGAAPPPRPTFPVAEDDAGLRVEAWLQQRLGWARALALKAIRKGWVRVEGKRVKQGRRLAPDEVVRVTNFALPLPEGGAPAGDKPAREVPPDEAERAPKTLRFQDEDVLVTAKPAGVVVHAGSGHTWGWVDAVAQGLGLATSPTSIGRLDRDTSGLLALARTRHARRELFAALREGTHARVYQALVHGRVREKKGEIDLPLEKAGEPGEEEMRVDPEGRPSVTRYWVEERMGSATLVRLELDTGRTHQIRAHFREKGHPLLGDHRYHTAASRELARTLNLKRLFLHASQLRFPHPRTGEELTFHEALPVTLLGAIKKLNRM
jgi:23S rRNA pseudouridine955/2504/2580 synthase